MNIENLTLFNITFEGDKLISSGGLEFNEINYSKFKYGSSTYARSYGHQLAQKFIQHNQELINSLSDEEVVITTPYKNVPTAATSLTNYFQDYINQYLYSKNLGISIKAQSYRQRLVEGDYGKLSEEARLKAWEENRLFINEDLIRNKVVIVIDDIKITGAYEKKFVETLKNIPLKRLYFLHIVTLDYSVAKQNPALESKINQSYVSSLTHIKEIMNEEGFTMNSRVSKFLMSQPLDALKSFLLKISDATLYKLYTTILADGNCYKESYKEGFSVLQEVLRNKEIVSNDGFTVF